MYRLGVFLIFSSIYFPQLAFAAPGLSGTWSDAVDIIINISHNVASVQSMIVAFLYVSGGAFFIKALYHLKVYGEMRTMMASQTSLKQPLTWALVGMVFVALPGAMDITMNSIFSNYNGILSYDEWGRASSNMHFEQLMQGIFMIVRLVGLVAFARGWFMIAQAAHQNSGGQVTVGKGVIHVIGGLMGINIVQTLNILDNTING